MVRNLKVTKKMASKEIPYNMYIRDIAVVHRELLQIKRCRVSKGSSRIKTIIKSSKNRYVLYSEYCKAH